MRVVIVDFNHLAYSYFHSRFRLSCRVESGGESVVKDTTVQSGTLKCLYRWSAKGSNPLAVCFDRPVPARKAFFDAKLGMTVGTAKEYKGGREKMPEQMFEAIQDVERMLRNAGVSVFAEQGYESDDLVLACIKRAKVKYPNTPIDVVTNDADLLPLVDDTVSVFLRSKTSTYAVDKSIEKAHYVQVIPDNFSDVVENLSAYRGYDLPYNTLLLHKLLRGDISDKFGRKDISAHFSPKKWNSMIARMREDRVNFPEVFRYGEPQTKIMCRDTGLEFEGTLQEALSSPNKSNYYQKIGNSEELDAILMLLREYSDLSEEQLGVVESIYWGMNLNQVYPNKVKALARRAYIVKEPNDINKYSEIELQKQCSALGIKLIRA